MAFAPRRIGTLAALLGLILVSLVGLRPPPLMAQSTSDTTDTHAMTLRGVPLDMALETLVDATRINLIYDAELVEDITIFCRAEDVPAEELLRCILNDTELDYYQTSAGTYVLRESPRRASFGRLAGVVVDANTGEPLPNANVFLADARTGTATNDAGSFHFAALLPGPHALTITHLGYETHVDSVWVPPDGTVQEEIKLESEPVETRPVVIDGIQQRLPADGFSEAHGTAADVSALRGIGTPDVARSLGDLMGTSLHGPLAQLHIQGGGTAEHELQLDGVPIRNPYSFGRLLGAFSPLAIGEFAVQKTGFGAEHGSHLAGVVQARHNLQPDAPSHLEVQTDPVSLNARAHGHVSLGGEVEGTGMVAVRHSLWDVVRAPTLHQLMQDWNAFDPLLTDAVLPDTSEVPGLLPERQQHGTGFADMHAATQLRLSPYDRIYASFYHGRNSIHTDIMGEAARPDAPPAAGGDAAADTLTRARDQFRWRNWAGQARYEWLMGARASGQLQLRGSHHLLRRSYGPEALESVGLDFADTGVRFSNTVPALLPDDGNEITELGATASVDYSLSTRHHLEATLDATRLTSRFHLDDGFLRPLTYAHTRWQWAGHVQHEISLGAGTTLDLGTRLTYIPSRQTVYAEPRLGARHDGHHDRWGDYGLRLATGLYRSFTNQFSLSSAGPTGLVPSLQFWLPVDASLAPPRAYHATSEAFVRPHPQWTVSLEAYYKHQPRLLALDYGALSDDAGLDRASTLQALETSGQSDFIGTARGYTYGAGVRLHREGDRLHSTLRYDYEQARRTFPSRFDDRLVPTPWNEPHRFSLETELFLTDGLSTGIDWQGVWGRTWGYRQAYYDYLAPSLSEHWSLAGLDRLDLGHPEQATLPPMYRLDASVRYAQSWGALTLTAEFMVTNVLDRDNVFDRSLDALPDPEDTNARTLPGRRPVVSITVGY